jgi:hypothetical protein
MLASDTVAMLSHTTGEEEAVAAATMEVVATTEIAPMMMICFIVLVILCSGLFLQNYNFYKPSYLSNFEEYNFLNFKVKIFNHKRNKRL